MGINSNKFFDVKKCSTSISILQKFPSIIVREPWIGGGGGERREQAFLIEYHKRERIIGNAQFKMASSQIIRGSESTRKI